MTTVVERLCGRCLEVCEADTAAGCLAMGGLRRGQRGVIMGFREQVDMTVSRRLFDLGFYRGVEVELVRQAPMNDPLMFRVGGCELLLRRAEADRIVVEVA